MSESMIVGVDHGYAAMKTAHFSFPSGLVAYEHEPYTLKDVLEYGGKFYVVGSGRQALQKNKTQTEDYYLLTLAAIAKELSFRHAEPAAEIHLAVDGEEFLESGYFAEETSDTGTVQVSGFWVSMTSEEETGERKH